MAVPDKPRFETSPMLIDERSLEFANRYEPRFPGLLFDSPHNHILRITMSGPNLNAADAKMHSSLVRVWPELDIDPEVDVVMIRGAGTAFSSGGSHELVNSMVIDPGARERVRKEASALVRNILQFEKLTVSAMHGWAVGAGLVVGVLADYSVGTRNVKIKDGHVSLGVTAGDHAVLVWPLAIGIPKTKRYLLGDEVIRGEEAERMGLISEVTDEQDLEQRALEKAVEFLSLSRIATQGTKRNLNQIMLAQFSLFEASLNQEVLDMTQPDVLEGMRAFAEKREPRFPSAIVDTVIGE